MGHHLPPYLSQDRAFSPKTSLSETVLDENQGIYDTKR